MKLLSAKRAASAGHILLTTIVITAVIGLALFAHLRVISSQNNFAVRSQIWNLCMPVVEAGLEEALAHVNNPGTTNFATQNWTWDSVGKVFSKQVTLGNSYYFTRIQTNLNTGPTITSTGYVPAPATGANNFLAAAMPAPGVVYISRTVRLLTSKTPLLPKALVVKNAIDFNGNNVRVDSYDSSKGAYGGANIGDKGDVSSNADIVGLVSTGNGDIWGHLSTGPKASVNLGPNGVIGSLAWHAGGNKGVQSGWLRKDSNVDMPDVQPPWTQGSQPVPTGNGSYKYILNGGNYEIPGNLNVTAADTLYVQGTSTLWVRGDFTMDGFMKMPTASLTVYVSGNISFDGTWDKSIVPADLVVYGLPGCTTINVATGSKIECALYAPEAAVSLVGNANFYGACVANSIRMNGTTGFHYDENLSNLSAYRGYVITSWQEL